MSSMTWLSRFDNLYHKLGNPPGFRWICDRYDQALTDGIEETRAELHYIAEMAQRCPKCEGYDFPGVWHNRAAVECSEYEPGQQIRCGACERLVPLDSFDQHIASGCTEKWIEYEGTE